MLQKTIADCKAIFSSGDTSLCLAERFPCFFNILSDTSALLEFLDRVSENRRLYPGFAQNIGPVEPLQYSRQQGLYFNLGGHEYISSISGSFRRHTLFSDQHAQALEIMVPGEATCGERALSAGVKLKSSKIFSLPIITGQANLLGMRHQLFFL